MSHVLTNKLEILKDRAMMLRQSRLFFEERHILEVDTPVLSQETSSDVFIDLIQAQACGKIGYLCSSAELKMKILLSQGLKDIYQLCHVFRDGEVGAFHNPEFTMVEWYRSSLSFEELIQETIEYITLFLGTYPVEKLSCKQACIQYAGYHPSIDDFDEVFAMQVQPYLGQDSITVITDFPAQRAALSQVKHSLEEAVAVRFELFFQGCELANGYLELLSLEAHEAHFQHQNAQRVLLGKAPYPIDQEFLQALRHGLPACVGVSVGFDRLMMLRHKASRIQDCMPFGWS